MERVWNFGDGAAVKLIGRMVSGMIAVQGGGAVDEVALHPLPPGISPEAQELLDVAVAYDTRSADAMSTALFIRFKKAVAAYVTSIAPPDPISELIRLARDPATGYWKLKDAAEAAERSRVS